MRQFFSAARYIYLMFARYLERKIFAPPQEQSFSFKINSHSYTAGEQFVCFLSVPPNFPISQVKNVSIDFFRFDILRNQFAFGFGATPKIAGRTLELEQSFPADMIPGFYGVQRATISVIPLDDGGSDQNIAVEFSPVTIQVRTSAQVPDTPQLIDKEIAAIGLRRAALARKPHFVTPVTKPEEGSRFLVQVFAVGCLIYARQQLEGYSILPLGLGLSHRNMWEIVNGFLESEGREPIAFVDQTEQSFMASTPIFVITYEEVVAADIDAASDYCIKHSQHIFSILGLDRGQKPRAFAYVIGQYDTPNLWHWFAFPGYQGNLLSDFNPVETSNRIERLLPRLEANPFSRLIVSTYGDATGEQEYGFALLRFWAVMELIAEHTVAIGAAVTNPDGSPILNAKGNPETTSSKHGRVYEYILSTGLYSSTGYYTEAGVQKTVFVGDLTSQSASSATEAISLWDMVRAVYAIRNSIAHEGQFDPAKAQTGDKYQQLAARLTTRPQGPDPLQFIKSQARLAIGREV
ncbi:MAG: hypothetical protein E5V65_07280 [Mesorhizobium sp.]|nr:MAG: hypothetical protein E5V65_07280 [Mesorhizobium sp.]